MDDLEEPWFTILGAILIFAVGVLLLFKIKYSVPSEKSDISRTHSRHISKKNLLYATFILSATSAAIFASNNFSNSAPASEFSAGTLPEQVLVEVSSPTIYGKENSAVPLKVKIANNGKAAIQDVHFEGQSENIAIPPNSTTILIVNALVKSFTSNKNMNITLYYSSSGSKYSKSVETSIYPIPNAEIKELEIKREAHNFIFVDQLEPGENLTLRLTVINRGTSKLPPGSIRILGFMEDFEVAANITKEVDIGLNPNGEYPCEISFKINENPPYGETKANVALIYNDTLKGELTLDQRFLQIKIVAKGTFF
jgi:hypothetical protein